MKAERRTRVGGALQWPPISQHFDIVSMISAKCSRGLSQVWGSGDNRNLRVPIVIRLKSLSKAGAERAVVNSTADPQQKIGPSSRPTHLLLVWTAPDGINCARLRPLLISDTGDRPWTRLSASAWTRRSTFSSFTG